MTNGPTFHERLHVPASWWLLGLGFVVSVWLALVVALPAAAVWTLAVVFGGIVVAVLAGYGAARVEVGPNGLTAGRATLDWAACGAPTALDSESARRLRGVDADARAYLLLRPYLREAVRVDVDDVHDPTPYWLTSTRHPHRLVDAIREARSIA